MSRIGNKTISMPSGVTVTVSGDQVVVRGTKGELKVPIYAGVTVEVADNKIKVSRQNDLKQTRAYHGLIRSLLNNHVEGVTNGFRRVLKLVGTGYRAQAKGAGLSLALGFSHTVEYPAPKDIKLNVVGTDTIIVEGIDKHLVGQVAANIRKLRPPEVYKGKGIRYEGEVVRTKQGKAAASAK